MFERVLRQLCWSALNLTVYLDKKQFFEVHRSESGKTIYLICRQLRKSNFKCVFGFLGVFE